MKTQYLSNCLQKKSEQRITKASLKSVIKNFSIVILLVLTSFCLQAQNINIMELDALMISLKASPDSAVVAGSVHLESLINDLQPTVYIGTSVKSNGGMQPVCAEIKAADIQKLKTENPLFSQVELITIILNKPSDINFVLDLSDLSSFTNLKYVYFLVEFDCTNKEMQKLYLPKTGISVMYKVSIPS
jgi:hypothetical protein